MRDLDEMASEYACSFINGNRNSVCLEILTEANPAVMAAKVALRLAKEGGSFDEAESFIRILNNVVENEMPKKEPKPKHTDVVDYMFPKQRY